jgi:predicted NUDIX family NTP pyrophosphohydrolase
VWAIEGDLDASTIESNTFEMEWPPKSGKTAAFPEVDRAAWEPISVARRKLLKGHIDFLTRLCESLNNQGRANLSEGATEERSSQTSLF